MKFAQNIHPTRLFGPTFLWNLLKNIHPTRLFGPTCLIGTWEYYKSPKELFSLPKITP